MKKLIFILLSVLTLHTAKGQEITGQWNGVLKVQGIQLRLVFNITKTENGFSATMDSPDQGAKDIPVTKTTFENSKLKLEITNAQIEYVGELKENLISGIFKQGGREFPMNLSKEKIEKQTVVRPQEPKKPNPDTEVLTFNTEEIIINPLIKGSLSTPLQKDKKRNLIILIAGSGPTDRDGNQKGSINNSLKHLSEELCKNDNAVFSYDKRIFAQITSGTLNETDLSFDDFITDAKEVLMFFKNKKKYNKIIIAGHSEGSLIGMIASNGNADAFISLAGAGRTIDLVLEDQIEKQAPSMKEEVQNYLKILKNGQTFELKNQALASLFRPSVQPYMISWVKYNPQVEIKKLQIPVLIINGSKDLQLKTTEAELLKQAKPDAKMEIIDNMNHIFKEIKGDEKENMATYNNPDLPVMKELISRINLFLKAL